MYQYEKNVQAHKNCDLCLHKNINLNKLARYVLCETRNTLGNKLQKNKK